MKLDHRWLYPYSNLLKDKMVLELGCGSGIDTAVILDFADTLVSADIKPQLNRSCNALLLDHSKTLPFEHEAFDTIVASLCLHYFSYEKTSEILSEISRVLKYQGQLLCRVNSFKDVNYGAVGFPEIESGLYEVNGVQKRFFKEKEIHSIWSQWFVLGKVVHKGIDRYEKTKFVYEFNATKA